MKCLTLEEDSQQLLKTTKKSRAVIQTKYILSHLKKSKSHFANINTIIISNANTVNSATTKPMITGKITYPATSTKSDTKEKAEIQPLTLSTTTIDTADNTNGAGGKR